MTTLPTTVPKTAVHKYCKAFAPKKKIGPSNYWLVPSPPDNSVFSEQGNQYQFSALISFRSNCRHYLRPLVLCKYIRHSHIHFDKINLQAHVRQSNPQQPILAKIITRKVLGSPNPAINFKAGHKIWLTADKKGFGNETGQGFRKTVYGDQLKLSIAAGTRTFFKQSLIFTRSVNFQSR